MCELIVEPCVLYHRRDRYMRALEKVSYKCIISRLIACIYISQNLLVVTTQEPDLVWMKVPKYITYFTL